MERLTKRRKDGHAEPARFTQFIGEEMGDKLADYEDAEEQDRLILLPVQIGERLYYANKNGAIEQGIVEYAEVIYKNQLHVNLVMRSETDEKAPFAWFIDTNQIGESVFTSLEEARIMQEKIKNKNQ